MLTFDYNTVKHLENRKPKEHWKMLSVHGRSRVHGFNACAFDQIPIW